MSEGRTQTSFEAADAVFAWCMRNAQRMDRLGEIEQAELWGAVAMTTAAEPAQISAGSRARLRNDNRSHRRRDRKLRADLGRPGARRCPLAQNVRAQGRTGRRCRLRRGPAFIARRSGSLSRGVSYRLVYSAAGSGARWPSVRAQALSRSADGTAGGPRCACAVRTSA